MAEAMLQECTSSRQRCLMQRKKMTKKYDADRQQSTGYSRRLRVPHVLLPVVQSRYRRSLEGRRLQQKQASLLPRYSELFDTTR